MRRRIALLLVLSSLWAAGPAGAGVTSSVEPATGLVDGQLVRLVVDGLPAQPDGGYVEILQCRTPITDRATDCLNYGPYRRFNPAGLLRARITVHTLLLLAGGTHDCRTGNCAFRVAIDGGPDAAAVVPLDFDPMGPAPDPPEVTATPTTGLVDGQRIAVHGTGLAQFDDVQLQLCPDGGVDADCLRLPTGTFSDENGEFVQPISAWTVLRPRHGAETDCRVTACILRVTFGFGQAGPTEIPLAFDPMGDVLVPAVSIAPHGPLGPRQSITVRLTGFHDLGGAVAVYQCLGRPGTAVDLGRCGRRAAVDPDDAAVRLGVRRLLPTAQHGDTDCSVRRCYIWVGRTLEARSLVSDRLVFRPRH